MGGKHQLSKTIVAYLEKVRKPGQAYLEPFLGGANVVSKMSGVRYASDIHEPLMELWQALQGGWVPPDDVSEELYDWYKKNRPKNDPMTAFVGFGCSFGGGFFNGYARDHKNQRNFARETKRGCLRKIATMKSVQLSCRPYADWQPENMLIYCDPPYFATRQYETGGFDHDEFWEVMRQWSATNTVVISEYQAPKDFQCVVEMPHRLGVRSKRGCEARVEKLFRFRRSCES